MPAKKKTKTKAKARTKAKAKVKTKTKTKTKAKKKAAARPKAGKGTKVKPKTKAKAKVMTKTSTAAKAVPKSKTVACVKEKVKRLSKKELDEARKRINEERMRIIRELGRIEETISDAKKGQEGANQSYSNHLADIGTDYMEQEKNFYYASQEGHYLRALDEALVRIEKGLYGICELCGCRIGTKRLEAVPSARQCIKCKSESEKNNRGR